MERLIDRDRIQHYLRGGLPYWRLSIQEFAADYILSLRGKDLSNISVLDVGCGLGHTLIKLSTQLSKNDRLVGVDIDAVAIPQAEAHARKTHGKVKIEFRCADAESMSFGNGGFNIIVANLSFTVFERPAEVASLVSRMLKPDGRLIASEVDSLSLLGKLGELADAASGNLYYELFSPAKLTSLFVPYGLIRIRIVKVPLTVRLLKRDLTIPSRLSPVFLVELSKQCFPHRNGFC
jgi:2-polyprenyl-3-methyl-5-hydroxy-6-metoxy-1,4-benzoquinol methylase